MVEWEGHRFLVGDAALTEPHHRYAARVDKASTAEEMAKFLAALALACRHYDQQSCMVATGLPPAHYKDAALKRELQERLTGSFSFRYQGLPYHLQVAGVTVDPQAGAALFDFLLHEDGEIREPGLLNQRLIVLDPGHRTTDVALMHGRKAAMGGRSILTIDRAVWHTYEECARLLMREYRLNLTPAEIDAHWRKGEQLRVASTPVPLESLMSQAAVPVARSIVADVQRHAGDVRLWDAVLLVGGGGAMFHHVLAEELGIPVRLAHHPEFANAAGYFKRQMER
jgi:hypothetical protein